MTAPSSTTSSGAALAPVSATALEARLRAPCCWVGTLDVHESDLAHALRAEVTTRLAQGERAETIQDDFVARYGERVLAARSDRPILALGAGAGVLVACAGLALVLTMRRWARAGAAAPPPSMPAPPGDDLDVRIDAELSALDG